mmetsp:Transcript_35001/g.81116  ORF Transcript_35001/g.81116 Transcript_35001/m.81116 type:complete len:88 (-) Transcript_35001:665-928(-)
MRSFVGQCTWAGGAGLLLARPRPAAGFARTCMPSHPSCTSNRPGCCLTAARLRCSCNAFARNRSSSQRTLASTLARAAGSISSATGK